MGEDPFRYYNLSGVKPNKTKLFFRVVLFNLLELFYLFFIIVLFIF